MSEVQKRYILELIKSIGYPHTEFEVKPWTAFAVTTLAFARSLQPDLAGGFTDSAAFIPEDPDVLYFGDLILSNSQAAPVAGTLYESSVNTIYNIAGVSKIGLRLQTKAFRTDALNPSVYMDFVEKFNRILFNQVRHIQAMGGTAMPLAVSFQGFKLTLK